jgi:hypothetical protein
MGQFFRMRVGMAVPVIALLVGCVHLSSCAADALVVSTAVDVTLPLTSTPIASLLAQMRLYGQMSVVVTIGGRSTELAGHRRSLGRRFPERPPTS